MISTWECMTVTSMRHEVGFLRAFGSMRMRNIVWPEGIIATSIGGPSAWLLLVHTELEARTQIASDLLGVLAPLLGVVLATAALLVASASNEYVRLLHQSSTGIVGFWHPFVFGIGVQIVALLSVIGYRSFAPIVPVWFESVWFVWISLLVPYVLTDILAIARNCVMHAKVRADLISRSSDE